MFRKLDIVSFAGISAAATKGIESFPLLTPRVMSYSYMNGNKHGRMIRQRSWLGLILSALLLAACGPRAANVAGTWEGTWISSDRASTGSFRVKIDQRGKTIKGPIELSLDWLPRAQIEGVVDGQTVRWGVLRGRLVVLTFEGRVNQDAAEGTYTIGPSAQGTWNARRLGR